jgi:hypothetical protein
MRRNSCHFRLGPILLALFIFSLTLPAVGQSPVDIKVTFQGEVLVIDATTNSGEPTLKMNPDPAYLEVTFPKTVLKGNAFSKAVDRGLIQKVVTAQGDGAAVTKIYVLSKPKATLSKTDTGYRYAVSLREMAGAPTRTAAASPAPAASPPAATTNPTPPANVTKTGPSAPINLTFRDTPLTKAINQMAGQAGLKSTVDPGLVGVVSGEFNGVPFEEALRKVLQPMADDVVTTYANDTVTVTKKAQASTTTAPTTTTPTTTAAATKPTVTSPTTATPQPPTRTVTADPPTRTTAASPQATSGLVREYFPFKTKSAEKALTAAKLAFPNVSYLVDPLLNVLMVEGTAEDVAQLEKFLRAQSPK